MPAQWPQGGKRCGARSPSPPRAKSRPSEARKSSILPVNSTELQSLHQLIVSERASRSRQACAVPLLLPALDDSRSCTQQRRNCPGCAASRDGCDASCCLVFTAARHLVPVCMQCEWRGQGRRQRRPGGGGSGGGGGCAERARVAGCSRAPRNGRSMLRVLQALHGNLRRGWCAARAGLYRVDAAAILIALYVVSSSQKDERTRFGSPTPPWTDQPWPYALCSPNPELPGIPRHTAIAARLRAGPHLHPQQRPNFKNPERAAGLASQPADLRIRPMGSCGAAPQVASARR